jgi:cell division protein FtsA
VRAERIIGVIDLGSSKTVALLGRRTPSGDVEILGKGECESAGVERALITSLEAAAGRIAEAMSAAEHAAGCAPDCIYLNGGGDHVRSFTGRAALDVDGDPGGVSVEDVRDVLRAAQAMVLPRTHRVLHVLPREFVVDGHGGIRDPAGMCCSRLEVVAHVVTVAVPHMENARRAVQAAGYDVTEVVLAPLAAGEAVLEDDERSEGVVLVDMGAGTTDLAVFVGGQLVFTCVIGLGGNDVTSDLGLVLGASRRDAERLKLEHGAARAALASSQTVEVPQLGTGGVEEYGAVELASVMEARIEETLRLAANQLNGWGRHALLRGCVVTGGGARAAGIVELASEVFDMRGRVGTPGGMLAPALESPAYACAGGLLLRALRREPPGAASTGRAGSWGGRVVRWFRESLA